MRRIVIRAGPVVGDVDDDLAADAVGYVPKL